MTNQNILELNNISFGYNQHSVLFDNLCLSLHIDDYIGIHAPNGSGKTTLFRIMTGLEIPQKGTILFYGCPVTQGAILHQLRRTIGFVLQNSDEQLFSSTVLEDIAFGPLNLGLTRREARDRALETLENIGMPEFADRPIHQLSGGEKKMISIASVLSMRPELLLLDEPTTFLDDASRSKIITLLQNTPTGRVIISHDKDFLKQTASSFVTIQNGGITKTAL